MYENTDTGGASINAEDIVLLNKKRMTEPSTGKMVSQLNRLIKMKTPRRWFSGS